MKRKILKLAKGSLKIKEEEFPEKKEDLRERERFLALFSTSLGLGFSVSLPIVFGAILGSYLDKSFGTHPKLTLSFIFLGVMIGTVSIFKIVKGEQ